MRTFYEGHDRVYQVKRENNEYGWGTPEEAEENFARIQALLPGAISSSCRILDLGCGSGELTWHYAKIWENVTGVDIAPTAIAWARNRLPNVRFIEGSVLDPAIVPAEGFDLLVDSNCLHRIIGEDRAQLLENAHRWLAPEGYLLLHTMCNEPVGDLLDGYSPKDRLIYRGDIAIRYLGEAGEILREVAGAGFARLDHKVFRQEGGPDLLVSLHQKPGDS